MSESKSKQILLPLFYLVLFSSGVAGIVNQVIWQRALKIYLGGSESLSSMLIVLVFLLGLGLGSLLMACWISRLRRPLLIFGVVELLLGAVNLCIAYVLSLNIAETIYSFQQLAVSFHIPLRLFYVLASFVILIIPCLLMGTTMPLAAHICQQHFKCSKNRLVAVLFFINTGGAVLGSLGSGFYLLPYFGQHPALVAAALINLSAATGALLCFFVSPKQTPVASEVKQKNLDRKITPEELLGLVLGFVSLGYEMYLFRALAIVHGPYPYTFSLILCLFLLFWSVGVFFAAYLPECILPALRQNAFFLILIPFILIIDRDVVPGEKFGWLPIYFIPCLYFGILYGQLISRRISLWGTDVGRFYALNTAGSCAGILVITLVGFEFNHHLSVFGFVVLLYGLHLYFSGKCEIKTGLLPKKTAALSVAAIAVLVLFVAVKGSDTVLRVKTYYGRDGVVEIAPNADLLIDGLWHSRLAGNQSQVGGLNWLMAVVPVLLHNGPVEDALVVGSGIGITAATLARHSGVKSVDTYEINHTLKRVMRDYPEATLYSASTPKIHNYWRDGRSGLALNSKKYDLITSAPLYLKQAGSSLLLSREYLLLAQARLKEGGVLSVFSFSQGNAAQALLVRKTVKSVFKYTESFRNGYLVIASDQPLSLDHANYKKVFEEDDLLLQELIQFESRLSNRKGKGVSIIDDFDSPRLVWDSPDPYFVSDNHPLLEYPNVVAALVKTGR